MSLSLKTTDVKRAINQMMYPSRHVRFDATNEVLQVVYEIWFSIKKNHTRKQTIRIINNMSLDEIELALAKWKLERSVGE